MAKIRRHVVTVRFEMQMELPAAKRKHTKLLERLVVVRNQLASTLGQDIDQSLTVDAIEALEELAQITRRARACMPKDKK